MRRVKVNEQQSILTIYNKHRGFTLGGVRDRWEYVVSGPAVYEMADAEPQAKAGEVCAA